MISGQTFEVEVLRRHYEQPSAVRLLMVCYHPTPIAAEVTRVGIESILRYTPTPFELWVVDNASLSRYSEWLRSLEAVNVVFNRTPPVPPRRQGWRARLGLRAPRADQQMGAGSYANAIGLELGVWAIDPSSHYLCVMHNDVLVLRENWLSYLQAKLSQHVRAAAMLRDRHSGRIGALHVSGLLFDFALFRQLGMSFMPDLPRLDVGDKISAMLRTAGYGEFVCQNTYNNPELVDWIAKDNPLHRLHTDRAFDDDRRVIFAHLGRGTPKSAGHYRQPGKTYPEQWIAFAREHVLA